MRKTYSSSKTLNFGILACLQRKIILNINDKVTKFMIRPTYVLIFILA